MTEIHRTKMKRARLAFAWQTLISTCQVLKQESFNFFDAIFSDPEIVVPGFV